MERIDWKHYMLLKADIIWYDHIYYGVGSSLISDRDYDKKMKLLEGYEEKFPFLVTEDSPTQMVGHDRFRQE